MRALSLAKLYRAVNRDADARAVLAPASTATCGPAKDRVIIRRSGSNLPMPPPAGGALWSGSRLSVVGDQVTIGR